MKKTSMVCIPFHDIKLAQKEGFRTRDSHLYKHFSSDSRIDKTIILNRPTMLLERILGKKKLLPEGDLIYSEDGVFITRIEESLFSVDTLDNNIFHPIIEGKKYIPTLYVRNARKYLRALEHLKINKYITYESSPLTIELCKKLNPFSKILDGVDNLCKHPTYKGLRTPLVDMYLYAINTYKAIFFNSTDSISYFSAEKKKNVFFLPNGVDFDLFSTPLTPPDLLKNLSKPIIIYAGKMQEMLDLNLLASASIAFPNATFVLLGKVLNREIKKKLSAHRNIIFGGDIKYENLPAYLQSADICFIPYRVDKQHGGDPIKFYEYMAVNKPIVTTPIGNIQQYHNGENIFVVDNDDFLASIRSLINYRGNTVNTLPECMTWKFKANYIIDKALSS